MTTALERLIALAGTYQEPAAEREEDTAGELVLAAMTSLDEAYHHLVKLASDDDGDDDSDGDGDEDDNDGDDHESHSTYKKLIKKGVAPKLAAKMCAKADDMKATATALDAARVALAGLETPYVRLSWEERTAAGGLLALASGDDGDGSKPYGDVEYADPGYQSDGKKRYPIDTEAHARAAWNYINKGKNAGQYSGGQLARVKARIKAAAKKFGIEISSDSGDGGDGD